MKNIQKLRKKIKTNWKKYSANKICWIFSSSTFFKGEWLLFPLSLYIWTGSFFLDPIYPQISLNKIVLADISETTRFRLIRRQCNLYQLQLPGMLPPICCWPSWTFFKTQTKAKPVLSEFQESFIISFFLFILKK